MFRRGFRRRLGQAARPDVPPLLRQAHQYLESGNYAAAAEAFEKVARAAEARNHPRAPQLYLQAGRAHILAGNKPAGFTLIKKGLGLLKDHPGRLFKLGNRAVRELDEHGMTAESQEIAAWLKTVLPAAPAGTRMGAAVTARKAVLPTHCPGCGGAVRADEVDWLDDATAECTWCGNPLRAEG